MGFFGVTQACLAGLLLFSIQGSAQNTSAPVIDEVMLEAFSVGAYVAYESARPEQTNDGSFDIYRFWESDDIIDAVILARRNGICYVGYQATLDGIYDHLQNVKNGWKPVCQGLNPNRTCCDTRTGWWEAYTQPSFLKEFEEAVGDCVAQCPDKDKCLFLIGASQGAALAALGAVHFADYNPYVVQLGAFKTFKPGCDAINPSRWFNFVNSGICEVLSLRVLLYDFLWPIEVRGEQYYGHMLQLSDDTSGMKYWGLNAQNWRVNPILTIISFAAHVRTGFSVCASMVDYENRLRLYLKRNNKDGTYPVRLNGFVDGTFCRRNDECLSNNCAGSHGLFPGRCEPRSRLLRGLY